MKNIIAVDNNKDIKFIVRIIKQQKIWEMEPPYWKFGDRITSFAKHSNIKTALSYVMDEISFSQTASSKVDLIEIFNEEDPEEIFFSWQNYK